MRIISYGDLYIDYYFNSELLIGICGGKSNANIISNLSRYYKTAFFGAVGNDIQGTVAIKSLAKLGVDVDNIEIVEGKTKALFINPSGYQKDCPYCGRTLSYQGLKTDFDTIPSLIQEDDIIVLDSVNRKSLEVLKYVQNKAFIELNHLGDLLYEPLDEFVTLLSNRFEIINMSGSVYKNIRKKFGIDSLDLYELLNPQVLIISNGKSGVDIIHDGILEEKENIDPIPVVESSGAKDAFFSEFIRTYLEFEGNIDDKMLSLAYMRASSLARFVESNYGARTHLEPLTKISNYKGCICESINIE